MYAMHLRAVSFMFIAMGGLSLPARAQTNPDAPAIQALLTEVRQLRLALERSALLTPKLQLTMQRIQLQDQKVARLSAQLEAVRRDIASQAGPAQRAIQELPLIEQRISAEQDLSRRKELEQHRSQLKIMAGHVIDPQLLARESEIASSLRTERAALDELTEKLAGMERLLDAPAPGADAAGPKPR
jgi:hypothetical protein